MINDASVVIGGGNWGIKEADLLGYKLFNNDYYARDIDFATSTADGTYMDSTGYVRRSPYNLFTYSEELDNVLWLKNNITIVPNAGIAPNNTYTADSYASTTTVGPHPCYQSKVVTRNTYTYSVYVKKVNSRYVSLKGAGGMTVWTGVIFDLDTASVVSIQNNNVPGTTGAITSEGNGWYRISMTATSNFNDFGLQYASSPSNNFGNYGDLSIAGSGLVDYLLWGMQVVQGSSPMPYFYTTTRLNVPRIDYSNPDGTLSTTGKLLMEPQRTNSIRNSSMVGAVAGTPGTLPTNWNFTTSASLGPSVVSVGTENGLSYVDLRYSGTASGLNIVINFDTTISASSGQVWSNSFYFKLITPILSGITYRGTIYEFNGTTYLTESSTNFTPSNQLTRIAHTRTLNNASTTIARPSIQLNGLTIGQTYDFTIRIAAPQMELGAYATTWIPTTTAAVTRNVDAASKTGVSSWIGQTEGTMFAEIFYQRLTTSFGVSALMVINTDGTFQNRIQLGIDQTHKLIAIFTNASVGQTVTVSSTNIQEGLHKLALKYTTTECKLFLDGVLLQTTALTIFPAATLGVVKIGNNFSNETPINNGVQMVNLYKELLTDAQCIELTTL